MIVVIFQYIVLLTGWLLAIILLFIGGLYAKNTREKRSIHTAIASVDA